MAKIANKKAFILCISHSQLVPLLSTRPGVQIVNTDTNDEILKVNQSWSST